jgi:hypothetical protein
MQKKFKSSRPYKGNFIVLVSLQSKPAATHLKLLNQLKLLDALGQHKRDVLLKQE